ncbi:MAG: SGNH/GDSL hydrolase family protein [Candidatus Sumerlaeaceae bacterium]|nr:SGNH/GDSL hydrolase family protein [Candidatus Sumerlaeaceae bacterium]
MPDMSENPVPLNPATKPVGPIARLRRIYVGTAILLLNLMLLFVLLNVGVAVFLRVSPKPAPDSMVPTLFALDHHPDHMHKVYPGWSDDDIRTMLNEMGTRPFELVPYTMFQERPYKGRFLNVSEQRFRVGKDQGPWPPEQANFNIFFFGGSTAFSYLLKDEEAIPSVLQDLLTSSSVKVKVYNFGQGSFYSTQERIQFQQLLSAGFVPDMAIFFDGLNDFQRLADTPRYVEDLQRVYDNVTGRRRDAEVQMPLLKKLPVFQLAQRFAPPKPDWRELVPPYEGPLFPEPETTATTANTEPHGLTEADRKYLNYPPYVNAVIGIYLENKKQIEAIAAKYGVKPVFVWQPVPAYKYEFRDYYPKGLGRHTFSYYGYPEMRKRYDRGELGSEFLWAADLQEGFPTPVYVDGTHYTAPMAQRIAECIGSFLKEKSLLQKSRP